MRAIINEGSQACQPDQPDKVRGVDGLNHPTTFPFLECGESFAGFAEEVGLETTRGPKMLNSSCNLFVTHIPRSKCTKQTQSQNFREAMAPDLCFQGIYIIKKKSQSRSANHICRTMLKQSSQP